MNFMQINCRKKEKRKKVREKKQTEEDPFAELKMNLANQEKQTQSDSLKDCSFRDEKNPLYNASKSRECQNTKIGDEKEKEKTTPVETAKQNISTVQTTVKESPTQPSKISKIEESTNNRLK
ncbi:unnamed protein product [Caenorhabditis angaria]|uniref:Uncharacterized protein n=1 Tax=Caenorhabditis angaria TaxID=860376 RepID=A0A9P1IFU3_9PELO|nr:unnamed protein product [Caenorhabditis angaria]